MTEMTDDEKIAVAMAELEGKGGGPREPQLSEEERVLLDLREKRQLSEQNCDKMYALRPAFLAKQA
jgi:hypothetical protein